MPPLPGTYRKPERTMQPSLPVSHRSEARNRATIEARLKSEDPRKAPDFGIMKTIGLVTLRLGEGDRRVRG